MINGPFFTVSSHGKDVIEVEAKNLMWKIFHTHCDQGRFACDSDGNTRPLSECDFNDVKFIAGLWRIQDKFNYPIQKVRGKEFVLVEKIDRTEKNLFEFYHARMVGRTCYGRYIVGGEKGGFECIVAKYETDKKTHWAYGSTIAEARAFLGIALYDEYQNLIHSVACKNKMRGK